MTTDPGWFRATRWWSRWAVVDDHYLRPELVQTHNTEAAAQAHATQLNQPRPARPSAQQDALFDTKEA